MKKRTGEKEECPFLVDFLDSKLIFFQRNRRLTFVITICPKGVQTSNTLLSLLALCWGGKVLSYDPEIVENEQETKLPENQANIALSEQNSMLING